MRTFEVNNSWLGPYSSLSNDIECRHFLCSRKLTGFLVGTWVPEQWFQIFSLSCLRNDARYGRHVAESIERCRAICLRLVFRSLKMLSLPAEHLRTAMSSVNLSTEHSSFET